MLSLHVGFAVRVYLYVERHGVAADGAVLDVVLVRTPRDIQRDHDLFAAGVADIRGLEVGDWLSTAACFLGFLHVPTGTLNHIVAGLEVIWTLDANKQPSEGTSG